VISVDPTGTSAVVSSPAGTGTVDVRVTTPGGLSAAVSADHFTYYPRPKITQVVPASGTAAGGTVVTITGTGLSGASEVDFGTAAATNLSVNSGGTQLTATSPAGTGTVDVHVVALGGTSGTTSADQFSYIPLPVVSIGAVSQNEGTGTNTTMQFPLTLSSASATPVTVGVQTSNGTAMAPGDYTPVATNVTIPAGQTSAVAGVTIIADSAEEPNETFTMTITSASGATIGQATATGTIINDDAPVIPKALGMTIHAPAEVNNKPVSKLYTFGLVGTSSLCSMSKPCPISQGQGGFGKTWNLLSQDFGTIDVQFLWNGQTSDTATDGDFSIVLNSTQVGTLTLRYTVTDITGLTSNVCVVTIIIQPPLP
jgi:hypothetical protein